MAYNLALEEKIDNLAAQWQGPRLEKKRMFGGIGYLLNGNMAFGIYKDCLVVRMSRELSDEKLSGPNTEPFDITGRPMKGWLMVSQEGWQKESDLPDWLATGRDYALGLPPK